MPTWIGLKTVPRRDRALDTAVRKARQATTETVDKLPKWYYIFAMCRENPAESLPFLSPDGLPAPAQADRVDTDDRALPPVARNVRDFGALWGKLLRGLLQ